MDKCPDFWISFLKDRYKDPLLSTYASSPQVSWSGCSVQIYDPSHSGFLEQQVNKQRTLSPLHQLDSFLISHLSPVETDLALLDYQPKEDLAEDEPVGISSKHCADFESMGLTSIPFQPLPLRRSSVTFSKPPSPLVTSDNSWNKSTRQQALTETIGFKTTESSGSGEFLTPGLEQVLVSDKRHVTIAKHQASDKGKKTQAKYEASDSGKTTIMVYRAYEKRVASRKKYQASDKGKEANRRYNTSDKGKLNFARRQAKYLATEKGKTSRAINNAKFIAYRSALNRGLSKELAREIGAQAAIAKKAELSLVASALQQSTTMSLQSMSPK